MEMICQYFVNVRKNAINYTEIYHSEVTSKAITYTRIYYYKMENFTFKKRLRKYHAPLHSHYADMVGKSKRQPSGQDDTHNILAIS